ncbi:MAG: type VI secretion system contractile sheath large subunit [Gemmataceae bacterium]|nr:type VI secretion system contractile sheath large subunit [Gemmataceae bacterium]
MDSIAVLAPLGGATETLRRFATIDRDNLDEVLLRLGPTLHLHVLGLKVDLRFRSLDDFEPAGVLAQVEAVQRLLDGEADVPAPAPKVPDAPASSGLLDQIVQTQETGRSSDSAFVSSLVEHAMRGVQTFKPGDTGARAAREAEASRRLAAILHHPSFQKLEAAWRGLKRLVYAVGDDVRVKAFATAREDLADAAEKAFAPSAEPFSFVLADFSFSHEEPSMELLAKTAKGRLVAGASPRLAGVESWPEWEEPRHTSQAGAQYGAWRRFRSSEAAKQVTLVLPRMLARLPWGKSGREADGAEWFQEFEGVPPHDGYLWMGSGWAFAERLITGANEVDRLPISSYEEHGETEMKCPTERTLRDDHAAKLHELGLAGLAHLPRTDRAAFVGKSSLGDG